MRSHVQLPIDDHVLVGMRKVVALRITHYTPSNEIRSARDAHSLGQMCSGIEDHTFHSTSIRISVSTMDEV